MIKILNIDGTTQTLTDEQHRKHVREVMEEIRRGEVKVQPLEPERCPASQPPPWVNVEALPNINQQHLAQAVGKRDIEDLTEDELRALMLWKWRTAPGGELLDGFQGMSRADFERVQGAGFLPVGWSWEDIQQRLQERAGTAPPPPAPPPRKLRLRDRLARMALRWVAKRLSLDGGRFPL